MMRLTTVLKQQSLQSKDMFRLQDFSVTVDFNAVANEGIQQSLSLLI